ncbi:hypothetical protein V6Z12_D06G143500 [Gossypium hirsutum]
MSREEFSIDEYQYLVNEMGRMLEEKLIPLKRRLDRVEEKARQKQNPPSRETESRSSRRYASKDYSLKDSYRDSYSSRNSRRDSFELVTFRYDKRERTSYSSYASKKSFPKDCSRRNGREAYENIFSFFEPNDYLFGSFVSSAHCNKNEKEEKESEKEKEIAKEKEIEKMREKENEEKKIEKEIEIQKKIEKRKRC